MGKTQSVPCLPVGEADCAEFEAILACLDEKGKLTPELVDMVAVLPCVSNQWVLDRLDRLDRRKILWARRFKPSELAGAVLQWAGARGFRFHLPSHLWPAPPADADYDAVSHNVYLSLDEVKAHAPSLNWKTYSSVAPLEFVAQAPHLPWSWPNLCARDTLDVATAGLALHPLVADGATAHAVERTAHEGAQKRVHLLQALASAAPMELLRTIPYVPCYALSANPGLAWTDVEARPADSWNWATLLERLPLDALVESKRPESEAVRLQLEQALLDDVYVVPFLMRNYSGPAWPTYREHCERYKCNTEVLGSPTLPLEFLANIPSDRLNGDRVDLILRGGILRGDPRYRAWRARLA